MRALHLWESQACMMIVGVARPNLVAGSGVVWRMLVGNALCCVCGIQDHACRHVGAHWMRAYKRHT
jgi:hypothetical protein